MLTLRTYTPADAADLWHLFYHTIRQVNIRDYTQAQLIAWAPDEVEPDIWQRKMDARAPFIAEIQGEIVGYADLQADGLIDHFFCHYQHQGKGVGRHLMTHIFKTAQARGLKRLYSEVSLTARPFYAHFGFQLVKAQNLSLRGQQLQNFVMEKHL